MDSNNSCCTTSSRQLVCFFLALSVWGHAVQSGEDMQTARFATATIVTIEHFSLGTYQRYLQGVISFGLEFNKQSIFSRQYGVGETLGLFEYKGYIKEGELEGPIDHLSTMDCIMYLPEESGMIKDWTLVSKTFCD